ncbi:metal ABC transporter substrate-binding protein [Peptococcaceae bacterium 1198_IL3148]
MGYKKLLLRLVGVLICLTLTACNETTVSPSADVDNDKITIYTTIYPLYDFTKNIGGNHVEVVNLIPAGAEPHSWEPSPQDIAKLHDADVLIYSGAGLEPWVDQIISSLGENKPAVVDSSIGIALEKGDEIHGEHQHGADPHIWLDPINAKKQVANIANSLTEIDPQHAADYQSNCQQYLAKLDALHRKYQAVLADVPIKIFITSHDAFGYLAKQYGLEQISIRGLSPEAEPSPARLAEIVKIAQEHNIKYVFFEYMVNPKVSQTLANEIGGGTLILNPVAGITADEIKAGKDYLSIMQENLDNLAMALGDTNEK